MNSLARTLIVLCCVAAALAFTGCATKVHDNDKLLWEGIDEAATNAPPASAAPR